MRRNLSLAGFMLSLLVISTTIQWTDAATSRSPADISSQDNQPVELKRVKYLARAYVYEPQDFQAFEKTYWEYEDFRPFYKSRIEVQIDDYDASQIRDEVLTEYDIIILTTPRDTLSEHDKSVLEKFEASKGIIIPSGKSAYDEISSMRYRFENGQLKSKQDIYIWEYHSTSLDIYYPEVAAWFTLENAQKNAAVAEQFYDFAQEVIDERPFHGEKISIAFFKYRWMSMAGQMIRMGILREEGKLFPPTWTFYHELAHDFSSNDGEPQRPRTSTAAYLDINIAFEEATANLFACYFASTFKYDAPRVQQQESFWKAKLEQYENRKISPYALNWHGHNADQQYLEAILFYISETYGWETWNQFFRTAKQSGIPRIPPEKQMRMEDLNERDASLALSRLVYLLSLAAGDDLRPQFQAWGFRIEPEVASLKLDKIKERPVLVLALSSNSIRTGDVLNIKAELKDMREVPIANETLDFFMQASDGTMMSLGRARTNSYGQAEANYQVNVDVGIYWVIASYEGSPLFIKRSQESQVVVNPLVWNVLSDGLHDLVDERGGIAGDLGRRYVDLAGLNYSFSGDSLYFRFSLQDKIPNDGTDSRVESIWYQVLFDVDSDSNTGFHWSRDFTPDYILQLYVKFDPLSRWVESYVMKYSGKGSDWSWTSEHETERFGSDATLAGGIGNDLFILACRYGDISVSRGSTIRFFGRSGILYDSKVYNDPVPSRGTVTLTLLLGVTTTSTTAGPVATSTAETLAVTASLGAQMTWLQTDWPYLVLALVIAAIAVVFVGRRLRSRPQ
jgi:hypothetical protein